MQRKLMSRLTIRRFEPTDAEQVQQLHYMALQTAGVDAGPGPWDDDLQTIESAYLDGTGEFLVGEADGQLVAMGALRHLTSSSAAIKRMRVHPAWQRRGFGRAILQALERTAEERHYATLRLDTTVQQTAAQELYREAGYVEVARTTLLGFPTILFQKRLRPSGPTEPPRAAGARARGEHAGFTQSCEPAVGSLLATLAAGVRLGARILEIGTGTGVGTGWLVEGLGQRSDAEVISVDASAETQAIAREVDWPAFVTLLSGDALEVVPTLGDFDLIFADAPAGKLQGLDVTLRALRPGGMLCVDDMLPPDGGWGPGQEPLYRAVRDRLLTHGSLQATELTYSSGVILARRRVQA